MDVWYVSSESGVKQTRKVSETKQTDTHRGHWDKTDKQRDHALILFLFCVKNVLSYVHNLV